MLVGKYMFVVYAKFAPSATSYIHNILYTLHKETATCKLHHVYIFALI